MTLYKEIEFNEFYRKVLLIFDYKNKQISHNRFIHKRKDFI
jgi:hypothetical protein